ncbi:kinase-like domain-containing protein [Pyronema domesticum]|nr:kinase-like domain-containing protein [Pyronema domesticum]
MAAPAYGHHHASHLQNHRGPAIPHIPPGTFPPGTAITVGAHKCIVERYLSEGGFAHVYLVKLSHAVHGSDVAVLKRVAVPDKEALASMRTEVDTMKRLKGHRHIVTYIDSHASHLKGGGYEVFLLMEFCSGGGLIDFMNTRLQHRLTEPEVLKIFSDVTQGVACMHYLQPPLLHRDLKVENVLIAPTGGYKVCDFGSCSPVKPAPQTVVECRLLEEDIQKHTTLQYRSPEMIDVFRRLPIDEKSDIWALGVLLYKLCYYTTPFEEQGQLAILNASFSFPSHPMFSDRLKNLIASMLREQPSQRPNIYQVVREVCYLRGREVPIKDIYTNRPVDIPASSKSTPVLPVQSPPSVIAYQSPVQVEQQVIPDIVPMRRGRPTKAQPASASTPQSAATSRTRAAAPSPQVRPTTSDPFAVLDKKSAVQDELSNRFPSVEQFSLLHDSGNKFQFGDDDDFNDSLAVKLAEDAFASVSPIPDQKLLPQQPQRASVGSQGDLLIDAEPVSRGITGGTSRPALYEPQPRKPVMVSTGTMTSPSPSPSPPRYENPILNQTLTSPPLISMHDTPGYSSIPARQNSLPTTRPNLLDVGRSQTSVPISRQATASRPSLEVARALSQTEEPVRASSVNAKSRPNSVYVESNLEFLRDLDSPSTAGTSTGGYPPIGGLRLTHTGNSVRSVHSDHIDNSIDYLRAMEAESSSSSTKFQKGHAKRASMPSITLPKPGNILSGKFGDAFKRFERGEPASPTTTSSPDDDWEVSQQEIPAEVRRELEKRQLSQEEKRVAAAAAEYKRAIAQGEPVKRNRANSIQKRVHALLNEAKDPPARTAEGYGRYTAQPAQQQAPSNINTNQGQGQGQGSTTSGTGTPNLLGSPVNGKPDGRPTTSSGRNSLDSSRDRDSRELSRETREVIRPSSQAKLIPPGQLVAQTTPGNNRPPPPPKPTKLRTGGGMPGSARASVSAASGMTAATGDLLGLGAAGPGSVRAGDLLGLGDTGNQNEDWERNFAKRYPSLSGLESS